MSRRSINVIPGRATSAFTRVFDALWREPGIPKKEVLDSGQLASLGFRNDSGTDV